MGRRAALRPGGVRDGKSVSMLDLRSSDRNIAAPLLSRAVPVQSP